MISGKTLVGKTAVKSRNILGRIYRCPVCGAELSVIKSGSGELKPICCNTKMIMLEAVNTVYVCSVCRSELMVIKDVEKLEPVCCNKKMNPVRNL
ncbi:MAG: hypothetical protein HY026_01780 [Deltaproteobacteria bacterium]|nr:hypothetical protein [Deltaproteobacteria bacterium]